MICDNEYLVNFDEHFQEQEDLIKEDFNLLEDTAKAFDSLNLEAQSLIKNSFDVEKVLLYIVNKINKLKFNFLY